MDHDEDPVEPTEENEAGKMVFYTLDQPGPHIHFEVPTTYSDSANVEGGPPPELIEETIKKMKTLLAEQGAAQVSPPAKQLPHLQSPHVLPKGAPTPEAMLKALGLDEVESKSAKYRAKAMRLLRSKSQLSQDQKVERLEQALTYIALAIAEEKAK